MPVSTRILTLLVALIAWPSGPAGADPVTEAAAERQEPEGALAWFKRGVQMTRQGDYRAALNRFERARRLAPRWALPHLEIAVAHLMTDNDRQAIGASLAKAVEFGPEIPRARYLYGVYLHEQGDRRGAIREFVQALKGRPSMLDARYRLATLYLEAGRQADGIEQYELVLSQQPSHLGARRNLAVLYEQSGQLEMAEKHLLAITRMDPQNAWYFNTLGRFYDRAGRAREAQAAFRRAQRMDPTGDKRRLRPLLKSRN